MLVLLRTGLMIIIESGKLGCNISLVSVLLGKGLLAFSVLRYLYMVMAGLTVFLSANCFTLWTFDLLRRIPDAWFFKREYYSFWIRLAMPLISVFILCLLPKLLCRSLCW